MVKDIEEWEERVRNAMKPPQEKTNFSPAIQGLRQTANKTRPQQRGRQLPTLR